MRKITAVTGTRAEYGILYPVLRAIKSTHGLILSLLVTGMHLSHDFGYTVQEIEKDKFKIEAKVDMLLSSDAPSAMAKSIGIGITCMAQALEQLDPDIVLVLGDRVEALAAAIAAAYMNIPLAHIHGGDNPHAGLDEYARHAITKFAHIHFPATQKSAERIIKMGEDDWRVHTVGSPALDDILNELSLPAEVISNKFKIDIYKPFILMLQHPITTQIDEAPKQIRETLEAVIKVGHPTVIIYPNSDAGGRSMIEVIKEFEQYPLISTFKSLPRRDYLGLMKMASVMIGNSSSGIIEAPSFGLPVVNIGIRQEGRERGDNIIDVIHNKQDIIKATNKALTDIEFKASVQKCINPYGDGKASQRIVELLKKIEITPQLLQKKITY